MLWDIFCQVIDNHGDVGVGWRLASDLAHRGETVRLWIDDASALGWMAPGGQQRVQVGPWGPRSVFPEPGDVVIESFGCQLPGSVVSRMAASARPPPWINLEYLTAEGYAQRAHGLPSPVLSGPGAGLTKHFFYPGFTPGTGGLLREPDLAQRQARFDRRAWLRSRGIEGELETGRTISLFCYEPTALAALLQQLAEGGEPTRLLVTEGRAAAAVKAQVQQYRPRSQPGGLATLSLSSALSISFLPLLTQHDYDHLLWSSDFNFVRGEDSLVRALWAGQPFAWQLYPQEDDAHHAKLDAFLDWMAAPPSLQQFQQTWNGMTAVLPALDLPAWRDCAGAARSRLLLQDDLATQLLRFVADR